MKREWIAADSDVAAKRDPPLRSGSMTSAVITLLTSVAVTVLGARLTHGIGRRAELERVAREYDVAERLPKGSILRRDLERIADRRLARYIAPELPEAQARKGVLLVAFGLGGLVLLIGLTLMKVLDLNQWTGLLLGALAGLVGITTEEWLSRRVTPRLQSDGASAESAAEPESPEPG